MDRENSTGDILGGGGGGDLVTFNGVSQLKLVNETITSKAYQDNIKSDIKLQYECTIPHAFNKITHLAIAL